MALNKYKNAIVRLLEVDSTNRYTRDEAPVLWDKCGNHRGFVVITAEHQTSGRGQRGNTWNSDTGKNLLFSILVRPGETLEVKKQFLLSQAVAIALHDAMLCYEIDTQLKWPNDIYVGNRKLAGILLELDYAGAFVEQAIIGIGLNINQEYFPPMDRTPVSIKMLRERDIVLDDVLATVLDLFEHYYAELRFGNRDAIATEYRRLLLGIDERHTFIDKNGCFDGVIKGVENDGHLIIHRTDGSLSRYAFKEVEQLIP